MSLSRRVFLKAGGVVAGSIGGGLLLRGTKQQTPEYLRPPGAGDEDEFLARCIRCAQCVEVCPTQVLRPAGADSAIAIGTPYLVARDKPCNLCQGEEELKCIAACPTDALQELSHRRDVRMGVAAIDTEICLPFVGVSCKACWHACPFPREAITFDTRGRPIVVEDACVGCGLCEYACLTERPAIRVKTHRQLRRERSP